MLLVLSRNYVHSTKKLLATEQNGALQTCRKVVCFITGFTRNVQRKMLLFSCCILLGGTIPPTSIHIFP